MFFHISCIYIFLAKKILFLKIIKNDSFVKMTKNKIKFDEGSISKFGFSKKFFHHITFSFIFV